MLREPEGRLYANTRTRERLYLAQGDGSEPRNFAEVSFNLTCWEVDAMELIVGVGKERAFHMSVMLAILLTTKFAHGAVNFACMVQGILCELRSIECASEKALIFRRLLGKQFLC
eukprot:s1474_g6.t1